MTQPPGIINTSDLRHIYNIPHYFSSNDKEADVYFFHTLDQGLCDAYLVEFKHPYSLTFPEKLLTLWNSYMLRSYRDERQFFGSCSTTTDDLLWQRLATDFEAYKKCCTPEKLQIQHKERLNSLLNDFIKHFKALPAMNNQNAPGIYKNGHACDSDLINIMKMNIKKSKKGVVIHDDWNEFHILLELENVCYFFNWHTGV